MRNTHFFFLLGLTACGSKSETSGDSGTNSSDCASDTMDISSFIDVSTAPVGELSCVGAALASEEAAAGCVAQRQMQGTVRDFQLNDPVDDATVEIFQNDTTATPPEVIVETDANGMFVAPDVMACQPFTYRVSTDEALGETKVTIESHEVMSNEGPTVDPSVEMNSVSAVTYALIPNLLGISPDPVKGIVAGGSYDCNGNDIEGLQVIIHDGSCGTTGTVPEGVIAKYFVDEFPSRTQLSTSEDGLWILLEVPEGDWFVDGYVSDGNGGFTKVASTQLNVVADSINIASLHSGISDGVKMPDSCLIACG